MCRADRFGALVEAVRAVTSVTLVVEAVWRGAVSGLAVASVASAFTVASHRVLPAAGTAGCRAGRAGAEPAGPGDAGDMVSSRPVTVHPPSPSGGRRVRVDGEILGLAHSLTDVAEFLRRAGLEDVDETDVERSALIEWRGGGPEVWPAVE